MDDGTPGDADVIWVARRVLAQHTVTSYPAGTVDDSTRGRCWHCTDGGCRQLTWATSELAVRGLLPPAEP